MIELTQVRQDKKETPPVRKEINEVTQAS